jgi:ketosteroid isomerase-like protein
MSEITEAMAKPYAAALKEKSVERALRLFTDDVITALKALPARPPRLPQRSD